MPLSMLDPGEEGDIRQINGRDELRAHLAQLGFVVGTRVRVVNALGGSLILQVKDSRVALDRAMANRIIV